MFHKARGLLALRNWNTITALNDILTNKRTQDAMKFDSKAMWRFYLKSERELEESNASTIPSTTNRKIKNAALLL